MNVASTSIAAHDDAVISGRALTHKARILQFLSKGARNYTRNEVAEFTHIRLSTVCGAVNALIKEKKLVEIGERTDKYTEARAKVLSLPLEPFVTGAGWVAGSPQ